jgi:hypothetical protein
MFCSGSESSQIEHFKPKKQFPLFAMTWGNFVWVCGICNLCKGERFPPNVEFNAALINPMEENAWDFFFIDEFGQITPRWVPALNDYDPRANATATIFGLGRDALQQSRLYRLESLKQSINDSINLLREGVLTTEELRQRVTVWVEEPVQQDVADYFLRGPGRNEPPFNDLFALI